MCCMAGQQLMPGSLCCCWLMLAGCCWHLKFSMNGHEYLIFNLSHSDFVYNILYIGLCKVLPVVYDLSKSSYCGGYKNQTVSWKYIHVFQRAVIFKSNIKLIIVGMYGGISCSWRLFVLQSYQIMIYPLLNYQLLAYFLLNYRLLVYSIKIVPSFLLSNQSHA